MRLIHRLSALVIGLSGLAATGLAAAQEANPPAAAAAQAAPADEPAPAAELHYSNKWRLEVSEGANNDGVMTFRLTPKDGTAIDLPVSLKKGRGENGCAQDIRDAFKAALDKKIYKVEVDDGEDVLVKKRQGPDFSMQLVESTVKGTRVSFKRE